MSKREVLYQGKFHTIELAVTANGKCPGKEFLDKLSDSDKTKILRIIKRLADEGKIINQEHFRKIKGGDFFEFKCFQIRMPCYFNQDRRIIITHGFQKGDPIKAQIDRMIRIRDEYEKRT